MRESSRTLRPQLACTVLTEQALDGRGAEVVPPGKIANGTPGQVGRDQGLDVCGSEAATDLPGSGSWSICRSQLGLFVARRWPLVDAF